MNFREHIDTLISNNADKEAFVELTDKILSSKPEAWMLIARGKIYWRQGKVSRSEEHTSELQSQR